MDLVVFYWLQWKSRGYALYWLTLSVWFVTYDPVDFFIVAFAIFGRYRLFWLVLAPLTKLPLGSELVLGNFSVWHWVLTSPNSLSGSENYGRYLILVTVWLASLTLYSYSRIHHRLPTCDLGRASGPVEDIG